MPRNVEEEGERGHDTLHGPEGVRPVLPVETLREAVESYAPYLQASGEMHDPIFGEPTQYGTPYHALCNAVLAREDSGERRSAYADRAVRGLGAALDHVSGPGLPPTASGFDGATGAVSRSNHRDFFWPPILKTFLILRDLGIDGAECFAGRISGVDIEASFAQRPPSNWAAVWLSGEWLRLREGLSPFSTGRLDLWLDTFFETHILPGLGLYQEPGHPNSYDLFTRYHLADMLMEGYDGGEIWIEEVRGISVGELDSARGFWSLDLSFRLTNVREQSLTFGSPTTEGRPAAGYGGLFWRGPRSFSGGEILAADGLEGPEVMGRASPWLAYVGLHDGTGHGSTVLFVDSPTNVRFPCKWFVRNDPYACVSCSFMFDEEYALEAGEELALDYRVVVGDGAWSRERIEDYVDGIKTKEP
ncbi:hypothetical protein BH20ACT12_BH20ACT12_06760 [soil metagenome]